MTNPTWAATDDSIDAWTDLPCSAPNVVARIDWDAADRAADRRKSFLDDLADDALRAGAWW